MKKRMYFIISAIIQIIVCIYCIANAQILIENQISTMSEMYSTFPVEFQERIFNMLENNGSIFIYCTSSIGILLNIAILKVSLADKILNKKGMLIAFSIICLISANLPLMSLLAFINFIVLLTVKKQNEDSSEKIIKQEIPRIEYVKSTKKEIIGGIILIVVYFSQSLILHNQILFWSPLVVRSITYLIILVLALFIFKDKLKKDIKLFKENHKAYFHYILPKYGLTYLIFIVANIICTIITKSATSVNQSMVEEFPKWFLIPAAIIWAPIVEELVFRGSIRRFIKNDKLFIIISAIIFGFLHSIVETTLLNILIVMIPYGILGGLFAYLYAKTNNVCTNIVTHALHNTIAVVLSSLFTFFLL